MVKKYNANDTTQLTPHFNAAEFKCKCGKSHDTLISDELVDKLEVLYRYLNCSKIIITSGYRCPDHDRAVGGSGSGQHTLGNAVDICCYGQNGQPISSKTVSCTAQDIGFGGIANITNTYQYTHVDVRTGGKWYGDETKGNGTVTDDFYKYYGIERKYAKNGVDISFCQKKVDWDTVQIDFAIIQIGGGWVARKKDEMFESHYAGAKKRGIPIGGYWFINAMTPQEAKEEAEICIQLMQGKQFEYPIYLDLEREDQLKLGKATVSSIVRTFLETVEKAGYWVGLYSSSGVLDGYIEDDIKKRYAIWCAHWGVDKPTYKGDYGIWQMSEKGYVKGIAGDVDLDRAYIDYPAAIKKNGLNGYGESGQSHPPDQEPAQTDDGIDIEVVIGTEKFKGKVYREVK